MAVFIILGVWMTVVARTVGIPPVLDKSGKVVFDEFGNAKDILLAILPLATASIGYWYGNRGTSDARSDANDAKVQAAEASGDARSARHQLAAVLDRAPPGALAEAEEAHPDAFDK